MYDQIAPYYDLIHSGLKEDLKLLITLAAERDDPVLELGCGTGRLLLTFSRIGHTVIGIDNSPAMLGIARKKLSKESVSVRERVSLVEGDITSFELNQRFGLVMLPYNTLFHLDWSGRRKCFRRVERHLRPGGRFVIDIDNPFEIADPVEDGILLLERSMMEPGSDQLILQTTSSWVDTDTQQRHMTWIFDTSSISGGAISRTVVKSVFHYVHSHELEVELRSAGLKVHALYGDYDREPYGEQSPRLLVVAEKAD
jgi:ubiquinone/menaquinone biosynthesis C-methylase UbiE